MGKINREELFKILDEQYDQCKSLIANAIDYNIEKLHNYQGDVIDIKTEISMGNTLEGSLFRSMDEDYYDKQKLLSESVPEKYDIPNWSYKTPLEKAFMDAADKKLSSFGYKPGYRTQSTVTAPKQHKKKYLIKLRDDISDTEAAIIGKMIEEQQFIAYNKGTIEQIITLDVE